MSQKTFLPTRDNFVWSSTNKFKIDQIRVNDASIKKTTFFVGIYASSGDLSGRSQYLLSASSRLVESLRAGDDGLIMASTPGAGQVRLTFTPGTSTKTNQSSLKYHIYMSRQEHLIVMYSLCGLERADRLMTFSSETGSSITRLIEGLVKSTVYSFNVVVEDVDGNRVTYNPQYVTTTSGDWTPPDNNGGVGLGTILGIAVPAFGVTLAFVVALIIKNRKLTKVSHLFVHSYHHQSSSIIYHISYTITLLGTWVDKNH
jgi:hypothetical protein